MSANSQDMFTKVGNPGTATTLAAPGHTSGGTSLTVVSTTNWPTGTGVIFAMDTVSIVDGVEVRDVGSYREFEGVVASSTSITGVTVRLGSDRDYAAGTTTRVYIPVAGSQNDRMVDGLTTSHNQDGTMITSLPLTTPKITTSINDSAGNEVIKTPATSSAVNEITVTNAATGNAPSISATGGDSAVHLNLRGKGLAKTVTIGAGATTIYPFDFVFSGCVWSGDAYASTLAGSMTIGVVVINGNPVTVAAVTAHAFTASKDTYIDVLDAGDGTGTVVYTEVTNNAASPALASNSIRIGIVVTGAGNIANVGSINQGQEDKVLPIASSIPYQVTDSLGNLICSRDPHRKILGYRQIVSAVTATTIAQATGLSAPIIIPTGRKVKITALLPSCQNGAAASNSAEIWDGVVSSGTRLSNSTAYVATATGAVNLTHSTVETLSAGSHTINIGIGATSNTITVIAAAATPAGILVELA